MAKWKFKAGVGNHRTRHGDILQAGDIIEASEYEIASFRDKFEPVIEEIPKPKKPELKVSKPKIAELKVKAPSEKEEDSAGGVSSIDS